MQVKKNFDISIIMNHDIVTYTIYINSMTYTISLHFMLNDTYMTRNIGSDISD